MIEIERLEARRAHVALAPLSFTFGPGVHALVGAPEDGGPLLLAALAGDEAPKQGTARLEGIPLGTTAARRAIAYVPLSPVLPDALRVDEVLRVAGSLRGDPQLRPAEERLGLLGLQSLAWRSARSLRPEEVRAVAMAEGLSSPTVRLLLIEEPFVGLDPRAAGLLAQRLRGRGRDGACVIVATSSPRDAAELADGWLVMQRGVLVRTTSASHARALQGGARLHVLASDPRALLAKLATSPSVTGIETYARSLMVQGGDPATLAREVGRAAVRAAVEILEMRPDDARPWANAPLAGARP